MVLNFPRKKYWDSPIEAFVTPTTGAVRDEQLNGKYSRVTKPSKLTCHGAVLYNSNFAAIVGFQRVP